MLNDPFGNRPELAKRMDLTDFTTSN